MDPIKLILNDHAIIRAYLKKIEGFLEDVSHGKNRNQELTNSFIHLSHFLMMHETMEQTLWYTYLKKFPLLKETIDHLIHEEKEAGALLKKMSQEKDPKELFKAFKKLIREVGHHASEEENNLFPKVRKLVSENELFTIGEKMMHYHKRAFQRGLATQKIRRKL